MQRPSMHLIAAALLVAAAAQGSAAQSLAQRVTAVGSGTVRLEFASKDGVCGNGRGNISMRGPVGNNTSRGTYTVSSRRDEWEDECEAGPVRLALDVENREVRAVRAYVGGRWRGAADRDLGEVSAVEASAFLMQLAATGASKPAKDALFPAMLADAPDPWRQMLAIAKDDARPRDVRSSATFWVSQVAGEAATEGLEELLDDEDAEVRDAAVFAISQRPSRESVPILIRLARSHDNPRVRRQAMFWLGQSKDERALAFFEEVLLRPRD